MKTVFITGETDYIGSCFIMHLLERENLVKPLIRKGSEGKLPASCEFITGNPSEAPTFEKYISPSHIFV
ncbi:MAG TPA: hypothetical protein VJY62_02920 [Bacteroidia bacterium]|nr:hypothetical protein [Bacteroidia bacterium]